MKNEFGASAEAIQFHYDVSNDFYKLWLDPQMVYSCALWHGDEDLDSAQVNKIDWHLKHSGISAGQRLLDVGCGWGAVLERASRHVRVREAVGLTLSKEQADSVRAKNLANVQARLEGWADHVPSEPYHGIISVGAFEHFANLKQTESEKLDGYRRFFRFCHDALHARGRLSLQTISYENSDKSHFSKFFEESIFPESDLPHQSEIFRSAKGLFEIEVLRNDREHYARTTRLWLQNLRNKKTQAVAMVGTDTYQKYEKYLALCVIGFHTGTMNLTRIGMRKI